MGYSSSSKCFVMLNLFQHPFGHARGASNCSQG
jgi:hypothetical protein